MPFTVRALSQKLLSLRYRAKRPDDPPKANAPDSNALSLPQVHIPMRDVPPDAAEQSGLRLQGRFLARQENWETLARGLRESDQDRASTIGGTPVARLLAEGACSDALDTAIAAVSRNDAIAARAALFALSDDLADGCGDPWLAGMLARAHVAVARAWTGAPGAPAPTPQRSDARAQHLETAARLLAGFDPIECDSPMLAELRCVLLELGPRPRSRVADDYEDLIDLSPDCPDHMRALGRDLMPDRYGSWTLIDREARRTAGRLTDVWGAGAYVWVWFDVLASGKAGAFARVDPELFAEGLHDILQRRPDQHMANLLAAYCGLALSGAAEPGSSRARICDCFGWIVQDHLREIHSGLWAAARPIPGNADEAEILRRGSSRAVSALAEHFAHQLRLGRHVHFNAAGVTVSPASCTLAPCGSLAYPRADQRNEDRRCLT